MSVMCIFTLIIVNDPVFGVFVLSPDCVSKVSRTVFVWFLDSNSSVVDRETTTWKLLVLRC